MAANPTGPAGGALAGPGGRRGDAGWVEEGALLADLWDEARKSLEERYRTRTGLTRDPFFAHPARGQTPAFDPTAPEPVPEPDLDQARGA